jgi:hypothetical protein
MCIDSVGTSLDSYDIFDEEIRNEIFSEKISCNKFVQKEFLVVTVPRIILNTQDVIQKKQTQVKPLGEGSYEVSVDKESGGATSASASIGYETENGTRIEGKGSVDNEGNTSGKISISGKF